METLLLIFIFPTFGNADTIRNDEQLERGESNTSLPLESPSPHASNVHTVFTEEQLERGERRSNLNNEIHSYNVETIFTVEQLARREVHLSAVLRNGIHSGVFPVVLITCNYNYAMSLSVSGERRGRVLPDNIITQTNNAGTVFNVEQLARNECIPNCFSDDSVIHGHNVAQGVIKEQVLRREGSNTVFSGDIIPLADNVEPMIAEVEQEIRESYVTVFSDNSVAGADNMQTVFTEEQIQWH